MLMIESTAVSNRTAFPSRNSHLLLTRFLKFVSLVFRVSPRNMSLNRQNISFDVRWCGTWVTPPASPSPLWTARCTAPYLATHSVHSPSRELSSRRYGSLPQTLAEARYRIVESFWCPGYSNQLSTTKLPVSFT